MDNDNSPKIQLKKCTSCLEELPYDQFGELTKSRDGYRDTCKGCRKTINARHYQERLLGFPNRIKAKIPLRSGNFSTLDKVIGGSFVGLYHFSAKGVNDQLKYSLQLDFKLDKWEALIMDAEGGVMRKYESWSNMDWKSFKELLVDQLFKLEIRLDTVN